MERRDASAVTTSDRPDDDALALVTRNGRHLVHAE
jgi:hypothetical protein